MTEVSRNYYISDAVRPSGCVFVLTRVIDRVCMNMCVHDLWVCVRWRACVFPVGRWDVFFPIIPAGLRSPLCSHAHILHSFPLQQHQTPSSGFGRQIFPSLLLRTLCFSLDPPCFPLTQLGRDCWDLQVVGDSCVCARVWSFSHNQQVCIYYRLKWSACICIFWKYSVCMCVSSQH